MAGSGCGIGPIKASLIIDFTASQSQIPYCLTWLVDPDMHVLRNQAAGSEVVRGANWGGHRVEGVFACAAT